MFKPYRRPTVLVLGGGVAGCTAAAECGFSGYSTTLIEATGRLGGRHARPDAPNPPARTSLRTPYLRGDGTDGSAASLCRQLSDSLAAPKLPESGEPAVAVRTNTMAAEAYFDYDTGYWRVTTKEGDMLTADVLVRATGNGTPEIQWSPKARRTTSAVDECPLHQGIQPVGTPNLLLVDTPEPPGLTRPRRPLSIVEARADHCRRYTRQLEIRGPGAMTVDSASWAAQKSTRGSAASDLRTVHTPALRFTPATSADTTVKEAS